MTIAPATSRKRRPRADATEQHPFTVEHFETWAAELELDNGEPWIVEPYFLLYLQDYFAGVPENWLLVPEGNAKTTNLGGLVVYIVEFRPLAAVPWAASSRDQAEIGYRQAEGFVIRSERLKKFIKCQEGYRRIKNTETGGRMQVFAADAGTGDGVIPTDAFLDELHRHKDLRLYRTWRGKLGKRGGQLSTISTAGEPGGEFETTRELIRQTVPVVERRPGFTRCRSNGISFHEYAVPEDGDVEDMDVVKLANPFTGITVDDLAEKRGTATMTLPHWRRFTCNLATRADSAAVQEIEWAAAFSADPIPEDEPVWAGLDVGWKWDTTSLVPLWMRDLEYRLFGPAEVLTPPRDGTSLDPHLVEKALMTVHARNPIHTLVMDMTRAEQLARWAEDELGCRVVDRSQGNAMAALDYERFMEALREGWLRHSGDLGLTRHVLNAIARGLSGGGARFDRPSSTRQGGDQEARVIDALVAGAMVNSVASEEFGKDESSMLAAWV
ncbi:MAG TPA: terminase large subunit [Gaiellaceae bacterium]|nr:terminase large subunit [Gaiellaceae bacterium]